MIHNSLSPCCMYAYHFSNLHIHTAHIISNYENYPNVKFLDLQHVIHIIGVLVSLLLFVATNYVCSILSTSYPPLSTVYGVFVNTTSMVEFWLLLPIVIVVALLPR